MRRKSIDKKIKPAVSVKYRLTVTVLVLLIAFVLLDARMSPVIKTIAQSQANNLASRLVDEAVTQVLGVNEMTYDDIVTLQYSADGHVSAIAIDSIKTNKLRTAISAAISEKIGAVEKRQISVPIGTLSGIKYFAGRGVRMKMYLSMYGSAKTAMKNVFESAGINQTRHQIVMEITTNISVILSRGNTSTSVVTNVIIAETIIVGLVPEIFAEAEDDLWQNLID